MSLIPQKPTDEKKVEKSQKRLAGDESAVLFGEESDTKIAKELFDREKKDKVELRKEENPLLNVLVLLMIFIGIFLLIAVIYYFGSG
ncbi:MAG TPA: hypothetical protein VFF09_01510 [archaeon]|nr:hypothetical protein [archaeon]